MNQNNVENDSGNGDGLDPRLGPVLARLEEAARALDGERYPGTAWPVRAVRRPFAWAAGIAAAAAAAVIFAALAWPPQQAPIAAPAPQGQRQVDVAMSAPAQVCTAESGGLAMAPPLPANFDSSMLSMPTEVGMVSSGMAGPWMEAAAGAGPARGNSHGP